MRRRRPESAWISSRIRLLVAKMAALLLGLLFSGQLFAEPDELLLWHSLRGDERRAIDRLAEDWNREHPEETVRPLAVPYDAYANKLTNAIPRNNGPDLFIAAHERIGDWSRSGLLSPLDEKDFAPLPKRDFLPATLAAFTYEGRLYGLPLAFKSTALFVNPKLLNGGSVPETTDQLEAVCRKLKEDRPEVFCLAYEAAGFYHHAAWLYGFGGGIFDANGRVRLNRTENARSLAFVFEWLQKGYIPEDATAALVAQLFNENRAAFVINGPWFLGEIDGGGRYEVARLPVISETERRMQPFLTVDGVLISANTPRRDRALEFARYLAGPVGAGLRAEIGRQTVALADDAERSRIDPHLAAFREQAQDARPMPNVPLMRSVWEPAAQALRKVLRGAATPEEALKTADRRIAIVTRPPPEAADPFLALGAAFLLLVGGALYGLYRMKRSDTFADMRKCGAAYAYLAPAALAMFVLVFTPFVVGTAVSLFSHRAGEYTFVGLANFWSILSSADYAVTDPLSFYFTLAVTVLWTVANVFLHVTLGLGLALLLRDPWLKLQGVYRVLLIVPWAVPNYITALIWKGMFHKQFGAINGLLVFLGLEPVSWFSHFWTAFAANLATNTWLGFPFMMVVTLGALKAIPTDLEEAAEVDGAGRVRRFFAVTLPLVKPALLPAVILGSVWTFNMFNIIYLVSGGEPDGATEILISEAYRWAFSRQEQYGYAAAYGTLIFLVLLLYNWGTKRVVREA